MAFTALVLIAGCAATDDGATDAMATDATNDAQNGAETVLLGEATYQLGLPSAGPVNTTTGLGIIVPEDKTHVLVTIVVEDGASVGLHAFGVAGCQHQYASPLGPGEPVAYDCTAAPGEGMLYWAQDAGRVTFSVRVEATTPQLA